MAAAPETPIASASLTVLVLTFNEAANLRRTLERLSWATRVVVVDSFSTDETPQIAREFPNVEVLQRPFDSFAEQCNWGLSQIESDWVLSLDADYLLTDELVEEIQTLDDDLMTDAYAARFRYCIQGIPLRSTLLPPRTVLYRRIAARYHNEGHGHRVEINGKVRQLDGFILHDDRKPLSRWLQSQDSYMKLEAPHLLATPNEQLSVQDRIRKKIFFAPPVMFFYLLFVRGLILDGWRGWYYVAQRTLAELLLSLRLLTERHGPERADS